MDWLKMAFIFALSAEALPATALRLEEIMNDIERSVVLPVGAGPLSSYRRNHVFVGTNEVGAVFFIPEPPLTARSGCVHGDLKTCSTNEIARIVSENAYRRRAYAAAGERRWFVKDSDLPSIEDGGCSQITIRYEISKGRVAGAFCNRIG